MATEDGMVGGVLVGKYELTAHLRPGRFGDFWRGVRLADRSRVAIKILKPELFSDANAVARFERETHVLAAIEHPNMLRVLDHGTTSTGAPWIVTEPHDGRVLSDAIVELTLSVEDVCRIGAEIASVLGAAHERGIVHRGLDPEAILLVDTDGVEQVKLQDFGLAHVVRTAARRLPEPALTQIGERLGRHEYMAPEYLEELVLDARTDLYVLGVILFEMVVGQPPFVGTPLQVHAKHVSEEPWTPSELSEKPVPAWLDALILGLLAKDPADRPQTGDEVAAIFRSHRRS